MCLVLNDPDGDIFVSCLKDFIIRDRENNNNFDDSNDDAAVEEELKCILIAMWNYINVEHIGIDCLGDSVFALKKRGYLDDNFDFTILGMNIINKVKNSELV